MGFYVRIEDISIAISPVDFVLRLSGIIGPINLTLAEVPNPELFDPRVEQLEESNKCDLLPAKLPEGKDIRNFSIGIKLGFESPPQKVNFQ